jgi:hypothetical protein
MDSCQLTLNSSHFIASSLKSTDNQLEFPVLGLFEEAKRSVADDSLSISQVHCVGLETTNMNPVRSSLQHNRTVLGVELQTN